MLKAFSLSLWDAYLHSICNLQPKSSAVKPLTLGCLFTQHMQPTAQKLCQAFYLWMLIHTAYMQPTAQKLCQAFHLWMLIHKAKAYALIHKAYAAYSPKTLSSLLLVDAYSQSICSLQPKNSVKPFTCGCLFTKNMQPTAQKLFSQTFRLNWNITYSHKSF